jgi:small conductance mechanosensitive channel
MKPLETILGAWLGDAWAEPATVALRVLLILLCAWVAQRVATRLIRGFRLRIAARLAVPASVRRAETLGRVVRYVASVVILLIAILLVLSELGISIAPLLGAAGVVGLAIGFGAQNLVKDCVAGFFLLLENQLAKGDVVQVAALSGVVEDVTLRYVQLRGYDGNVHFVPNGLITTVTNMSRDFAFAVVEVGISYRADFDNVFAVIRTTAAELRADSKFRARIIDDIDIAGVENWAESAVVVRMRLKVEPLQQWAVRREFLRRLKLAFDAHGIEIPYPHLRLLADSK